MYAFSWTVSISEDANDVCQLVLKEHVILLKEITEFSVTQTCTIKILYNLTKSSGQHTHTTRNNSWIISSNLTIAFKRKRADGLVLWKSHFKVLRRNELEKITM